jgi:hypothetical protein
MGKTENVLVGVHTGGDAILYLKRGLSPVGGFTPSDAAKLSILVKEMGSEFSGFLFNPGPHP